jgi:hypothetical protein
MLDEAEDLQLFVNSYYIKKQSQKRGGAVLRILSISGARIKDSGTVFGA